WQREWWRAFGGPDEQLLIVLAEREGQPCAIAPLFAAKEMLFLVGSDGSDYLDFIGQLDESMLCALLDAARRELPDFAGVGLYHVPRSSPTTALLPGVAERLGLQLHSEGEQNAPYADLSDPERAEHLVSRRSVRKAEARMLREGPLLARAAGERELEQWLEPFFLQHAQLWPAGDGWQRAEARDFCSAIVRAGVHEGWLRFSMLEWRGHLAAFEITLIRGAHHLSYLGSRDTELDRYSPGAVLQAHVVRAALAGGARRWDFGLGEEPYKLRDASGVAAVTNWFLYPA
ncbi:MAG TPA: GNAT family N-acetyltransferase, partial [Solirubrobacteraceae bacterium]|nr:GNAT family N-acetyltransferase [Solirubrobacteraceae bacterium]